MKQVYLLSLALYLSFGISMSTKATPFAITEPLSLTDNYRGNVNVINPLRESESSSPENVIIMTNPTCSTYSLPFNESFDISVEPECWTQYSGVNALGPNEQWEINATSHTGPGAAYLGWENVSDGSLAEDWLVTPALDMTGSANNEMTFWTKDGFTGNQGSVYSIKVSTTSQTDISTFVELVTYTETQLGNSYNEKTVDLSAYSGNVIYIAFVMSNDDGDAWFLDDVSVYDSTVCTPPSQATALNTNNIDGSSGTATLNWTHGEDNVLIVMRSGSAVNTDPSTGTTYIGNASFGSGDELGEGNYVVYNGTSTTIDVSNLNPNTTYHVAIYTYDNSETCYNTEQLSGTFFIPCGSFSLPFNEGFETASFPPTCWTSYRGSNGLGPVQDWRPTPDANTGSLAAFVDWEFDPNGSTEDWLVTPAIAISPDADASLSFFTKDGSDFSDYGSIYTVRISTTSQTDRNSFTTIASYTETELGGTYNEKTIDLSAYNHSTIYIAFVLEQNFGDSWILDDINVTSPVPNKDFDTEVYTASIQIEAKTIIAETTITLEDAEDAFAFSIDDSATSDLLPTFVTAMRFVPGSNNSTDWTDVLQGIVLKDENDVNHIPSTVTIDDNEIILGFNPAIVIPNGTTLNFTLGFYLNDVPITDGSIVQFQLNATASGFTADDIGSIFSTTFSGGTVTGNDVTIDSSTLNITDSSYNDLRIFSISNPRTLFIKGKINAKSTANVYDMQGKLVLSSFLESGSTSNEVNVEALSNGIYIVKVFNSSQQKTQKVIIK